MLPRSRYVARVVDPAAIEPRDVEAWAALEARTAEPNAYLSPHFVLPATRWLTAAATSRLVFVERTAVGSLQRALVAVGVFALPPVDRLGTRALTAYRSRHSLLGGLLLDRDCVVDALNELAVHAAREWPGVRWIELPQVWDNGALAWACRRLGPGGIRRGCIVGREPRAVLATDDCQRWLACPQFGSRRRDLERRMRRLRERGAVAWRLHRGTGLDPGALERFLALEHMGWKGQQGSSLRSSPQQEAFIREAVAGFASEGRALFTELMLDGEAIAATCNFISGDTCFAFKIGWDPSLRSMSPAMLNEFEMLGHPERLIGIRAFDSGADPSSFINALWPAHRFLTTVRLPADAIGSGMLGLLCLASKMKHALLACAGRSTAADANPAGHSCSLASDGAKVALPVERRCP
ncbi:MAG: GNAT family N-acetyltransferase [Ideonella sp.]|nr:GNAT family N-acetyltransferase [Ideonella sp.]